MATQFVTRFVTRPVTRFAPSPTGRLHLGHAWSALLAHDAARAAGGTFCLRIEDIDTARCRERFVDAIYEDLAWLGIGWDGAVIRQSERSEYYRDALNRLIAMGLAYRCACTRADIAAACVSAPHGAASPVYPGTCRGRVIDPALPYCWRIDMAAAVARSGLLTWQDEHAGIVTANPINQGDIVIARKDALSSYHLAVTVDDAAQGIAHVIRGRDLFAATDVHRLLQALLGLPVPTYRHHALIVDDSGDRLAKRRGSVSLSDLRAQGWSGGDIARILRAGFSPLGFAFDDV